MNIYETEISDISFDDINKYENLGKEIEKCVLPVFFEESLKKQEELLLFENALKDIKNKLKEEKDKCKDLSLNFEKQKLIKNLLSKIYKVLNFGLVDKKKKDDIILLLKGLDNLDIDLIKRHNDNLQSIINSSINKNDIL
jgi:hypothetical protein